MKNILTILLLLLVIDVSGSARKSSIKNRGIKFSQISHSKIKNSKPKNIKSTELAKSTCRICCEISVDFGGGYGLIGFSACAGSVFTSCGTAGEKACKKVYSNLLEVMQDTM